MSGTDDKVVTGRLRVKVTECFLVELHDTSYQKVNIALSHLKGQNSIVLKTLYAKGLIQYSSKHMTPIQFKIILIQIYINFDFDIECCQYFLEASP